MRRFVASASVLRRFSAVVVLAGAWFVAANAAQAVPTLRGGTIDIQITSLDPVMLGQSPSQITSDGGLVFGRDGSNQLTSVQWPAGIYKATGFLVPVTDPNSFPIVGVLATASNDPANFVDGASFGGQMPLNGGAKVCLYGTACGSVANVNLTVPLSVVGKGGAVDVDMTASGMQAPVFITVIGAPWTTGTAAIGTITRMGSLMAPTTQMTAMGGTTVTNVAKLVTPIFVSTNIPTLPVVPVFGTLNFTIPEPGTIAAFGAVIAALVSVGYSRRRK